MRAVTAHDQAGGAARVSTIELFFDLVFVFTLTQVVHLVEHAQGALDFLRAILVLTLVWWIFAGYAWLTNSTGTARRMRPVLLAAMVGFLVMAISIPEIFHDRGLTFGLGYLFVVLLHLGAFASMGGPGIGRAVLRLAPFNVGAALLTVLAGALHTSWSWVLFAVAVGLLVIATLLHTERGFPVNAPHFVHRHGHILLIALGETVVALGAGAVDRPFDARLLGVLVLCIALLAAIWWSYFDRDDAMAEHALVVRDADERASVAIRAFWTPYLVMIFGILLVAAGLNRLVAEPDAATTPAWLLASGLAVYLLGSALFRIAVRLSPAGTRVLGALLAVPTVVIGLQWGGVAQVAALSALVCALLLVERRRVVSLAAVAGIGLGWPLAQQPTLAPQQSGTSALLIAVSAVNDSVVWVSGANRTYLRTVDGGATWTVGQVPVPDAPDLQFRDVHAVDANAAFLLSIGPGSQSRIFKTTDAGTTWRTQFVNDDSAAFYDCFDFWSPDSGIVIGDAVGDQMLVRVTTDGGATWNRVPPASMPRAIEGEGSFAASGTCVVTQPGGHAWIGTTKGRVLHTADYGRTWSVSRTPITTSDSVGVVSVAFRDALHGIAFGGFGGAPGDTLLAFSSDGGATWSVGPRPAFRGGVSGGTYAGAGQRVVVGGFTGAAYSPDEGRSWVPLDTANYWGIGFAPSGTGWLVGRRGRIVKLSWPGSR